MKKIAFIMLISMMLSCASIHPGKYGKEIRENGTVVQKRKNPTKSGILMSGDMEKAMSSDFYKFMVFTIENKTGKLGEISDVNVKFQEDKFNNDIKITSGHELSLWYDATMAEKIRKEQNRSTAFSFAAIGGGLLAAFTDNTWSDVGVALLAGGVASLTIDELYKSKKELERGKVFPNAHLMSREFQVPGGLYERKWIVFNVTDKDILPESLILSYTINGIEEKVLIPVKW
jgi:hypothetical protein